MEKYALLSVFDKTGIVDFAEHIAKLGYKIISTGGTAKALVDAGIQIIPISEITGNPESFDGLMKTISFQIEAGILFDRNNPSHVKQAKELKVKQIDLVVCNLYPFEQTIAKPNSTEDEAIENIDVGGPTMIRAAAKNYKSVVVITDPNDYKELEKNLETISIDKRKELSAKAFAHLSFYDSQIAAFLGKDEFPDELTLPGRKITDLRYGENPHQKAALYASPNNNSPLMRLEKKWGRDLSLINVTYIDAGLASARMFDARKGDVCAVVIKHNSPSGIALGSNAKEALERAIEGDPESAFGGGIVINTTLDLEAAGVIAAFKDEKHGNIDVIAVPNISDDAFDLLTKVRKSMGIYTFGKIPKVSTTKKDIKWIDGGFILQDNDTDIEKGFKDWKIVTKKQPTEKQAEQMQIAWKFITKIKSNSVIVVDQNLPMTRGIGTGQTSRVRAAQIALEQAAEKAQNGILASDSFFPFGDSVELAAKKGILAIVQQGGSINDKASIDAADKAGIAMVFTNRRSFWH